MPLTFIPRLNFHVKKISPLLIPSLTDRQARRICGRRRQWQGPGHQPHSQPAAATRQSGVATEAPLPTPLSFWGSLPVLQCHPSPRRHSSGRRRSHQARTWNPELVDDVLDLFFHRILCSRLGPARPARWSSRAPARVAQWSRMRLASSGSFTSSSGVPAAHAAAAFVALLGAPPRARLRRAPEHCRAGEHLGAGPRRAVLARRPRCVPGRAVRDRGRLGRHGGDQGRRLRAPTLRRWAEDVPRDVFRARAR